MFISEIIIDLPQGGEAVVPTAQELLSKYPFVVVLLGLMLLDIITGLIAAFTSKVLCSTASYRGMLGKVQMLGMVAAAMLIELVIPGVPWGQFVAIFFCVTEAISITENAANSGVPIPAAWAEALRKAKVDSEKKKDQQQVVVNINETDPQTVQTLAEIKDSVNEASRKAQEAAKEAAKALRDSGVIKHSDIVRTPRKDGN
jgi:toxin secretion/phage lysis holin